MVADASVAANRSNTINSFHSRSAYLQAAANVSSAEARGTVLIRQGGEFNVLVRYEAVYHFNQGFRIEVSQNGTDRFSKVYGLRNNKKLWAFSQIRPPLTNGVVQPAPYTSSCGPGLQPECVWTEGPVENILWEGPGDTVRLEPGLATVTLVIDESSRFATEESPLANRNLDVIMLFPNSSDIVARSTAFETSSQSLALDGLLSQSGEVYAKFHNMGPDALDLTLPFMHYMSPGPENHLTKAYWNSTSRQLMSGCTVYGDTVTPQMIGVFPPFKAVQGPNCTRVKLQPGAVSEWTEVGSNFDTLMFGTWEIPRLKHCATSPGAGAIEGCPSNRTSNFSVAFAVVKEETSRRGGGGATIDEGQLDLLGGAFINNNYSLQVLLDASTRATRRVRPEGSDLTEILAVLDSEPPSALSVKPSQNRSAVPFYATTFSAHSSRSTAVGFRDAAALGPMPGRSPPSVVYNKSRARFLSYYNLTGTAFGQSAVGSWADAPAFDKMLSLVCWACPPHWDPISDPNSSAIELIVNGTMQALIRRGVNRINDPFVTMGDEITVQMVPNNATNLPAAFQRWAETRGLSLSDMRCQSWHDCFLPSCLTNTSIPCSVANASVATTYPERHYYSSLFAHDYGIEAYRTMSRMTRKLVPHMHTTANFSPLLTQVRATPRCSAYLVTRCLSTSCLPCPSRGIRRSIRATRTSDAVELCSRTRVLLTERFCLLQVPMDPSFPRQSVRCHVDGRLGVQQRRRHQRAGRQSPDTPRGRRRSRLQRSFSAKLAERHVRDGHDARQYSEGRQTPTLSRSGARC